MTPLAASNFDLAFYAIIAVGGVIELARWSAKSRRRVVWVTVGVILYAAWIAYRLRA